MRLRLTLALVALASVAAAARAEDFKDPVFDVPALIATPLEAKVLKQSPPDADGVIVEEVQFHSETDGDKRVDIFGILAYPKDAKGLPAFVWNQGGLGQASAYFPVLGAKRGYVALCIDFPLPGYRSTGGYPINSGLELPDDPRQAPIYHGAVALLQAVSYLQSRPEVDKDRIGMCGSSWGGFFTTLMCGVDPRLKAGSAMFGSGSMQEGNTWWASKPRPAAFLQRWRTTLDPAWRLQQREVPMAWFTGTNDFAYWMPGVMKTYEMNKGPKHLTLLPNFNHGLTPKIDDEVFAFLDTQLKGAPGLVAVSPLSVGGTNTQIGVSWRVTPGQRKVASVNVILSYGVPGNWQGRAWKTLPAKIQGEEAFADLPRGPMPYFISGTVVDTDGYITSTPLQYVDLAHPGLLDPSVKLDYDGADPWGELEEFGVWYLQGHSFFPAGAAPTTDAHGGKGALSLKPGATSNLHWLHFTPGVAHRATCWLKADKPVEIKVALAGSVSGEAVKAEKAVSVGGEWVQTTLDVRPPEGDSGGLSLDVTAPEGVTLLVDDISLRPIEK